MDTCTSRQGDIWGRRAAGDETENPFPHAPSFLNFLSGLIELITKAIKMLIRCLHQQRRLLYRWHYEGAAAKTRLDGMLSPSRPAPPPPQPPSPPPAALICLSLLASHVFILLCWSFSPPTVYLVFFLVFIFHPKYSLYFFVP